MGKLSSVARLLGIIASFVAAASLSSVADAQIPGLSPATDAALVAVEEEAPPEPLPAAAIPQNARAVEADLGAIEETLRPSGSLGEARANIETDAADLKRLSRLASPEALVRMSRIGLEDLEREMEVQNVALRSIEGLIEERLDVLNDAAEKIRAAETLWTLTREALHEDPDTPEGVVARTDEVLQEITEMGALLAERVTAIVELDNLLEAVSASADLGIRRVHRAQAEHRARLFRPAAPAIWKIFATEHLPDGLLPSPWPRSRLTSDTWDRMEGLYGGRFTLDIFLFALFMVLVLILARHARATDSMADPILTSILGHPLASGLLVGTIAFRFLYFRAPSSVFVLTALLAVPPLFILTPTLARREELRRPLFTLLLFCTLLILSLLFPSPMPWRRLVNLGLTVGFLWFLIPFVRGGTLDLLARCERGMRFAPSIGRFSAALLGISLLGEVFGFTTLSGLLTSAVLIVGYASLLLLAFVRVLDALIESALTARRSNQVRVVRRHGRLIQQKASYLVHLMGLLLLVFFSARAFDIYDPVYDGALDLLESERTLGSWSFRLEGLLGFFVILYLTRKLTRMTGFILEEELLPRLDLERGVPETVTRLTKYLVFTVGFLFAVGVAGVDMSSVALLASALSVGIGFGLQNVVNNFVSGLILTFERPVRVGDTVEVDNMVGKVKSIGARSSTIRTFQGSEVILPNADLISNSVINWTRSDPNRRVAIQIGVAYGTSPDRVLELLRSTAMGIREVMIDPGPVTLFTGFGDNSLDFELRVWVNTKHDWVLVASDLRRRIYRRLEAAHIEIPFPQRDLHLRSVDEDVAKTLNGSPEPTKT